MPVNRNSKKEGFMVKRLIYSLISFVFVFDQVLGFGMVNVNPDFIQPELVGVDFSSGYVRLLYKDKSPDKDILKEDLGLFLTGIAFPIEDLVVDLNIYNLPSYVLAPELEGTEIGRIFLESDVKLKKMVQKILSTEDVGDLDVEGGLRPSFRIWIQPGHVKILESPNRDRAEIKDINLQVRCEFRSGKELADTFKRLVLPRLEKGVNRGEDFAPLRRAIKAVLLAQWYKERAGVISNLDSLKDSRYSKIFESKEFWITRDYMDEYVRSYWDLSSGVVGGISPIPEQVDYSSENGPKDLIGGDINGIKTMPREEVKEYAKRWTEDLSSRIENAKGIGVRERAEEVQKDLTQLINALSKMDLDMALLVIRKIKWGDIARKEVEIEIEEAKKAGRTEKAETLPEMFWAVALMDILGEINKMSNEEEKEKGWNLLNQVLEEVKQGLFANEEEDKKLKGGMFKTHVIRLIVNEMFRGAEKGGDLSFVIERQRELVSALEEALGVTLKKGGKAKEALREGSNPFAEIGFDKENFRMGWVRVPSDKEIEDFAEKMARVFSGKKNVIFVGMGGSINTVKLLKSVYNLDNALFFDTPDKGVIKSAIDKAGIDLRDTAVVLISKSGTTYETKTIGRILKDLVQEEFGKEAEEIITSNFVWLVDKGNEEKVIEEDIDKKIEKVYLQPNGLTDIGGRYSSPWTGVFLSPMLWRYINDPTKGLNRFVEDMVKMSKAWERIILNPDNPLNKSAYKNAFMLFNKTMVDGYGPRIAVFLPDSLPPQSYEPFRIWVTQLWQESIGGKKDGIYPKIELITPDMPESRVSDLLRHGFVLLDLPNFTSDSLYRPIAYMYLLATYFSAFSGIKFLTQENVQLYKRNLKKIKQAKEPPTLAIDDIVGKVGGLVSRNEKKEFVDIVFYGSFTNREKQKIVSSLESSLGKKVVIFWYDGPDYNHHSFEALATDPHTIPVLLVHPKAGEDVIKVAQATAEVFGEDVVYGKVSEKKGNASYFPSDILSSNPSGVIKGLINWLSTRDDQLSRDLNELKRRLRDLPEMQRIELVRDEVIRVSEIAWNVEKGVGKFTRQIGMPNITYELLAKGNVNITFSFVPYAYEKKAKKEWGQQALTVYMKMLRALSLGDLPYRTLPDLLAELDNYGLLDVPAEMKENLQQVIEEILQPGNYRLDDVLFLINMVIEDLNYGASNSLGRDMIRLFVFLSSLSIHNNGKIKIRLELKEDLINSVLESRKLISFSKPSIVRVGSTESDSISAPSLGKVNTKIRELAEDRLEANSSRKGQKVRRNPGGIWARPDVIEFLVR